MWRFFTVLVWISPLPAAAQAVTLASGQEVTLMEVLLEGDGPELARFRFLAPAIDPAGQAMTYAQVASDMDELCQSVALPALADMGVTVDEVVISFSDRPIAFGEVSAEATQFFEPFTISDSGCERSDY